MLFLFMSQPDFACNPHALWDYIKKNTNHDTAWIVKKKKHYEELISRGITCAVYDTSDAEELLKKADYIIQNSYTFTAVHKAERQVLVNLWHGSGIKAHDFYNHDMELSHVKKIKKYFEQVDLMCVHSLDDRFKLSAMLNCDLRKIYVTGQARLDNVSTLCSTNKLKKLYGNKICQFDKLIYFAPSFRANMTSHAGKLLSDNIFRLDDYDNNRLYKFLSDNNAAIIYKLHPIEQTAFNGRIFEINDRCFELTDEMLFNADIRYDELLSNFDVMVSDYSSVAYDFLLLNRSIVYLIPDYDEYKNSKGFVFNNIDLFMPGRKAYNFNDFIESLAEAFEYPDKYADKREQVIKYRFDYTDGNSAKRCYEKIINFKKANNKTFPFTSEQNKEMPSVAEHLSKYIKGNILLIDSAKPIEDKKILLVE